MVKNNKIEGNELTNKVGKAEFTYGIVKNLYLYQANINDVIVRIYDVYHDDRTMNGTVHVNGKRYFWGFKPTEEDKKRVYIQNMDYNKDVEDMISEVCEKFNYDDYAAVNFNNVLKHIIDSKCFDGMTMIKFDAIFEQANLDKNYIKDWESFLDGIALILMNDMEDKKVILDKENECVIIL